MPPRRSACHLPDPDAPARAEAHPDIGRHLIATDGAPMGAPRAAGVCQRCPEPSGPCDMPSESMP